MKSQEGKTTGAGSVVEVPVGEIMARPEEETHVVKRHIPAVARSYRDGKIPPIDVRRISSPGNGCKFVADGVATLVTLLACRHARIPNVKVRILNGKPAEVAPVVVQASARETNSRTEVRREKKAAPPPGSIWVAINEVVVPGDIKVSEEFVDGMAKIIRKSGQRTPVLVEHLSAPSNGQKFEVLGKTSAALCWACLRAKKTKLLVAVDKNGSEPRKAHDTKPPEPTKAKEPPPAVVKAPEPAPVPEAIPVGDVVQVVSAEPLRQGPQQTLLDAARNAPTVAAVKKAGLTAEELERKKRQEAADLRDAAAEADTREKLAPKRKKEPKRVVKPPSDKPKPPEGNPPLLKPPPGVIVPEGAVFKGIATLTGRPIFEFPHLPDSLDDPLIQGDGTGGNSPVKRIHAQVH